MTTRPVARRNLPRNERRSLARRLWFFVASASLVSLAIVIVLVGVPDFLVGQVRQAIVDRDYQHAKTAASQLRNWPGATAESEFWLARIARHEEQFETMVGHLERAAKLGLARERLRREELLAVANQGRLSEIEGELRAWLADARGDEIEISRALVNGLAADGRFEQTHELLDAWQVDAPQDPEPHYRRARIHDHLRQKDLALAQYQQALHKDPRYMPAAFGIARILDERKQTAAAWEYYRRCAQAPDAVPALVGMAVCLKSLGRSGEAIRLLEQAVAVDSAAREAAYRAIGEQPETLAAARELGQLQMELGDLPAAERWLAHALRFNPRDLLARYSLAVVYRDLGHADLAARQFEITRTARQQLETAGKLYDHLENAPDDIEARFELGRILLTYESERRGRYFLNTVLTRQPEHAATLRLLDQYQRSSAEERLAALGGSSAIPAARTARSEAPAAPYSEPVATLADTATPTAATIAFTDRTADSGVSFVYDNGEDSQHLAIIESLGGGVGVLDFDRDGIPDLCLPGGGELKPPSVTGLPHSLWRGTGNMQFANASQLSRLHESAFFTHGVAVGDCDNDGFPEVLITGYGGLQFYVNQGDGTFREQATARGLADQLWSSSAGFGDFNADGILDLFVVHYVDWSWERHPECRGGATRSRDVCSPKAFEPLPDTVYLGRGDGTFFDASREMGVATDGKGLGVMIGDLDGQHGADVYVANDTTNNHLYLNRGQGQWEEAAFISGTAVDQRGIPNGSMGIAVLDFNHDLLTDLWVTNYENETFSLYAQRGEASFVCVSESAGITNLRRLLVGFGTVAADFDQDQDEDIVIANGHVMFQVDQGNRRQESVVLANDGSGHFRQLTYPPDHFFSQPQLGRGLAAADLDADGDLDLVCVRSNDPVAILANDADSVNYSFQARLVGQQSNRDGIGARVLLHTSAGDFLRLVTGGGSYLSQGPFTLHWGLRRQTVVQGITVHWPSGATQYLAVRDSATGRAGAVVTILESAASTTP